MNDSTKRLRKKMRESEHDYSWQRKIVKGIRRVSFAIMILWSVGLITESNRLMDNPTEITRADVDNVVATLQANDADFMTNMIGGEDKFGKPLSVNRLCAEVKSLLIDLEVLQQDDRAQATYKCAA